MTTTTTTTTTTSAGSSATTRGAESPWHVERGALRLKPGKDVAVRRRHPWVFSGAVAKVEGDPQSGDVVVVLDARGELLGRACYSPQSQIRARLLAWGNEPLDDARIAARVDAAVALRERLVLSQTPGDETTSARLLFAEGDGLPGFVADLYDDTLVLQCQSAGAERLRDVLVDALVERVKPARVYERSDADIRALEGLPSRKGLLRGAPLPDDHRVTMHEHGMRFTVDVDAGHKTGFYLDQRDSRRRLRGVVADKKVLNCFCYTGGFSIAALKGGARHVTSVDTSQAALQLGQHNALDNGFADERHDWLRGDCFDVLRGLHEDGERYDVVVLDPPKFAPSARHLDKAARGYKDLMIRGLRLLPPGGLLLSFSCSGAVDRAFFRTLAAQASLEAGRPARVLAELGHAACHPVPLAFPEGEYLKGLMLVAE
ncbi:MAG: class I SAM-dependent rRNA methyltransferase [Deltaproteobacteria bacterium]|nr:class I SAM-dependent rRNA methyltransferase [Deltaproteobacteria bacterium]